MEIKSEKPFIINGVKSWIQCIEMRGYSDPESTVPNSYHFHDYIELLYSIDTRGYVWISGEKISFNSGEFVIINSNTPHTVVCNPHSIYFCIKFSPQILYADETSLFEFKYMLPFLNNKAMQYSFKNYELKNMELEGLLFEIMNEWKTQGPAYELVIRANLLKLFAGIIRYWHEKNILSNEIEITDTLKNALMYIDENLDTVTEAGIAKYCHISYNHFSFLFKKAMGKSFSEYITFLRLGKAENLLLSTNKSITAIAIETGFSTSSYFISQFKKYKGVTPRQFRVNIQNTNLCEWI